MTAEVTNMTTTPTTVTSSIEYMVSLKRRLEKNLVFIFLAVRVGAGRVHPLEYAQDINLTYRRRHDKEYLAGGAPICLEIQSCSGYNQFMKLTVNGTGKEAPDGTRVAGLLDMLGLSPDRVAVELNRVILPRESYADALLKDGDSLEIVGFVGGG